MADALLDTAPCGFILLAEDGTVLLANSTLARWINIAVSDLAGMRFEAMLSLGGRVFYQTHFFPLLKLKGHCEEIYLSLRGSNEEIPVLVNGVQLSSTEGVQYSLVLVQMRQRERYEEELLMARRAADEANARLAEANVRLQSLDRLKDELLAVTSHDIGGLATTIRLSIQMLMREKRPANFDPTRYIRAISDATDRLLVLLRDLSDLALANTGQIQLEPTILSLSNVAAAAVESLTVRADAKSIALSLEEASDSEPYVQGDYNRLYQVVSNLLGNALKFTPVGGKVIVKVQMNGDRVALSVKDTGVGIPADKLAELFAHFKNVSHPGTEGERGSGLGLAIVRRLVELHGGELTVESVEDVGSVFTISLPTASS